MGYSLVLYPVSLLLHSIEAMQGAAEQLKRTAPADAPRATFDQARSLVGWPDYEQRLRALEESDSSTGSSTRKT